MTYSAHFNALFTNSAWPGLLLVEYLYCSSWTEIRGSAHSLHLCVFYVNGMAVNLFSRVVFRVEAELISFHSHWDVEYDGWGCQTLLLEVNKRKAKDLIQSCSGKRLTLCKIILFHYFLLFCCLLVEKFPLKQTLVQVIHLSGVCWSVCFVGYFSVSCVNVIMGSECVLGHLPSSVLMRETFYWMQK